MPKSFPFSSRLGEQTRIVKLAGLYQFSQNCFPRNFQPGASPFWGEILAHQHDLPGLLRIKAEMDVLPFVSPVKVRIPIKTWQAWLRLVAFWGIWLCGYKSCIMQPASGLTTGLIAPEEMGRQAHDLDHWPFIASLLECLNLITRYPGVNEGLGLANYAIRCGLVEMTRKRVPHHKMGLSRVDHREKIERSAEALRECHLPIPFPPFEKAVDKNAGDCSTKPRWVASESWRSTPRESNAPYAKVNAKRFLELEQPSLQAFTQAMRNNLTLL